MLRLDVDRLKGELAQARRSEVKLTGPIGRAVPGQPPRGGEVRQSRAGKGAGGGAGAQFVDHGPSCAKLGCPCRSRFADMSAAALLEALRARGVDLIPDGDRLRIRPVSAVSDDLRAAIQARRAELLVLLGGGAA